MKYLLITDIPTPWREKVFEKIYKKFRGDFHVVYCSYNEKRRLWKFPLGNHPKTFLKSITTTLGGKERFFNLKIISFLLKNKPQIVVWFGFQPTVVLALFLSKFIKSKFAVLSDTWLERDKNISWIQKVGRKLAYNYFADAFIGVSKKTLSMYKFYNNKIKEESLFLSPLCADNKYFDNFFSDRSIKKKYDIMFSGRIVDIKNPLFFAEIAAKIKDLRGSCSVLIIGDGDENLKMGMFNILEKHRVHYHFAGFIEHERLPEYYSQAKILLFPTSMDCWGVVINEAFVSGLPVITTAMTAAAGELVLDGKNGYILPMDSDIWAEKASSLLRNGEELASFSNCARETVKNFDFEAAASGIITAIEYLNGEKLGSS